MSADHHDHSAHHADHHGDGIPHASLREYLTGFVLSAILTAIPFWLVMNGPLSNTTTAVIILAFAIVQIIVHMIFFLHMNPRAEGGWSLTALVFTVIVVAIMLSGSLWVMHHLNANMMPSAETMREMP